MFLVVLLPRLRCGHHVWGLLGGFSSWFKIENQRPHIHKGPDRQGVSETSELYFHVCLYAVLIYLGNEVPEAVLFFPLSLLITAMS